MISTMKTLLLLNIVRVIFGHNQLPRSHISIPVLLSSLKDECSSLGNVHAFINDRCFFRSADYTNYIDAWSYCKASDAHLAHIHTYSTLTSLIKSGVITQDDEIWIGLEKVPGTSNAVWVKEMGSQVGPPVDQTMFEIDSSAFSNSVAALNTNNFRILGQTHGEIHMTLCEKGLPYANRYKLAFKGYAIDTNVHPLMSMTAPVEHCSFQCLKHAQCTAFSYKEVTSECHLHSLSVTSMKKNLVPDKDVKIATDQPIDNVCDPLPAAPPNGNITITSGVHSDRWAAHGATAVYQCSDNMVTLKDPTQEIGGWINLRRESLTETPLYYNGPWVIMNSDGSANRSAIPPPSAWANGNGFQEPNTKSIDEAYIAFVTPGDSSSSGDMKAQTAKAM